MTPTPIRLAEDTISAEELQGLARWLAEGHRLTIGPLTQEFEQSLAGYLGAEHCVMVNSGSSANLLMASALWEGGYLRNKRVIVPAVSWVTTLAPFMQLGFECHLCDSAPTHLGVSLAHLESLLAQHDPALLVVVHVLGHPNPMAEIRDLCAAHDCLVIEDACEALGTRYQGRYAGTLSTAGSFSFYYGHQMSTIEGGAVVTDDPDLRHTMLSLRSHGWARDLPESRRRAWREEFGVDEFRDLYTFYHAGFNLRPTDLSAYLGLGQLDRLPSFLRARRHNFQRYRDLLPDFWSQTSDFEELSSLAYGTFVENRLEVARHLAGAGVETRPLICGSLGRQPFWTKARGEVRLPVADLVHDHGIYLPNHARLTDDQVEFVANEFKRVAEPAHVEG